MIAMSGKEIQYGPMITRARRPRLAKMLKMLCLHPPHSTCLGDCRSALRFNLEMTAAFSVGSLRRPCIW